MNKKCSLKTLKEGKILHGTAAQLHKISICGGWDNYHHELVSRITEEVYNKIIEEQNKPILTVIK